MYSFLQVIKVFGWLRRKKKGDGLPSDEALIKDLLGWEHWEGNPLWRQAQGNKAIAFGVNLVFSSMRKKINDGEGVGMTYSFPNVEKIVKVRNKDGVFKALVTTITYKNRTVNEVINKEYLIDPINHKIKLIKEVKAI